MDALGPVLADMADVIVEGTRCAPVTAAQSVLAVAALAAQAHADVLTPAGLQRPLSLFLATVALSGERKSAADTYALQPIRDAQDEARESYREARRAYENALDAWEGERRKIVGNKKSDAEGKRSALDMLGAKPLAPLHPERTVEDVTCEGLIKSWPDCHGSRGLFSAEGAKVLGGHSMSDEARLRTAATYSGLWDDGRAERIRAGEGVLTLRGRRLTAHLMMQPDVSRLMLNARDLNDQGLIGRFLICEAPEQAGARLFRLPPADDDPRRRRYWWRVSDVVKSQPATLDGRNELNPRVLTFEPDATALWIELHDWVEVRLGSEAELGGVKPFGNKLAEHAARIAGVLTLFADPGARTITAEMMERTSELAKFYACEAVRLHTEGRISEPLREADRLLIWLKESWPEPLISHQDAQQKGPKALRDKAKITRCFTVLQDHGWLTAMGPGAVAGKHRRETFKLVNAGFAP